MIRSGEAWLISSAVIVAATRLTRLDYGKPMEVNPYDPPSSSSTGCATAPTCQRRIDVMLIAFAFVFAWGLSAVSVAVPSLNEILRPRFGASLNLLVYPTIFLGFYLWRPASRYLWIAAFMSLFVGVCGGLSVWRLGTVDVVSNPYSHRLHSSYLSLIHI